MNLSELVKGKTPVKPVRIPPNEVDYNNIDSSLNLNSFGFPANFDENVSFQMYFYIDENVRTILSVGLTLTFQKFRTDAQPLPHSHSITIGNHTHGVTVADHTHGVTIGNHDHSVTLSNHTHNVSFGDHDHSVTIPIVNGARAGALSYTGGTSQSSFGGNSGNATIFVSATGAGGSHSISSGNGGGTTVSSSSGGGTSTTSASGGGQTVTSASGGGTTVSSDTTAGSELGVFEGTYPADVELLVDGINRTLNLGGPWNPADGDNVFRSLDITPFVKEGGLHYIEVTTTQQGRCLPLLWVKSIISR